ncbi:MAG: FtsX-like permease family protein [SAR202 cluster bacterium]|nr:FtsX-like permease family protein [SAR202 cluster bacterium]
MRQLTIPNLVRKRIADDWKLLVAVFAGVLVAVTLAAGTPVYLTALDQLAYQTSINRLDNANVEVTGGKVITSETSLRGAEGVLDAAVSENIEDVYTGREEFFRTETGLTGTPANPLPPGNGKGIVVGRGYVQSLTNLEQHSRFLAGQMSGDEVLQDDFGWTIEAVVYAETAVKFGLRVNDEVRFSPSLSSNQTIKAKITGVFEPLSPTPPVWQAGASLLSPQPLPAPTEIFVQVEPGEPPITVFATQRVMDRVFEEWAVFTAVGGEQYVQSNPYLAGTPSRPLPAATGEGVYALVGHLHYLSNLGDHIRLREGRMATDRVEMDPNGPFIETVLYHTGAARRELKLGEQVIFASSLGANRYIKATVVGIMEPDDVNTPYWSRARAFLDPPPASDKPTLAQDGDRSPLPLFVTRHTLFESISSVYPGMLGQPTWVLYLDKDTMKVWPTTEARARLRAFEQAMMESVPGSQTNVALVRSLTREGERQSLFARIPMLLLLTVTVFTVLFLLSVVISYLVESRQSGTALLRSRGVSGRQLLVLYLAEGLLITAPSMVLAPVLAIAAVALAGYLPYFSDMTGGGILPIVLEPEPFVVSFGLGMACLATFVLMGLSGTRGGLLAHKLRQARPLSLPLFQRYYLDVALIVIGGLIFWELRERGQFASGGLFTDIKVNEPLLLAPVLFLLVVALLFMRFFPMIVRFVAGESTSIVHLVAVASAVALAVGITVEERNAGDVTAWLWPVLCLAAFLAAYGATQNAEKPVARLLGIASQAALLALVAVMRRPLDLTGPMVFAFGGLTAVAPLQLFFMAQRELMKVAPVFLSMGLWRMARNPMQYTWFILILVLATGLGILSTTVGGTLERSREDRVRYETPSDLYAKFSEFGVIGGIPAVRENFDSTPGINKYSLALRQPVDIGTTRADLLAVDTRTFADTTWYRSDFADRSLKDMMEDLHPSEGFRPIPIPVNASSTIGLWVKPIDYLPFVTVMAQVADRYGAMTSVFIGRLSSGEWHELSTQIPEHIAQPRTLVSIQVYEEGASGQSGEGGVPVTPGTVLFDDVFVTTEDGRRIVLEDFEGPFKWTPIYTWADLTERVTAETADVHSGQGALRFSFTNLTARGLRGFYVKPADFPMPVLVSSRLAEANGYKVGDTVTARINLRWMPVVIKDIVDYFPTVAPTSAGFMVADINAVMGHMNNLMDFYNERPHEAFIEADPTMHESITSAINEFTTRTGGVSDATAELESLRSDPLTIAGWEPLALLAPLIGLLAAAVGYVTYLLLFAKRSGKEMGSLRFVGLSRGQLASLLGFEHLAVAAIGLGIGTWAGMQMSRMMVSPLAVTENGDPLLPPFILTTDMAALSLTYVALAALFLAAVFLLNRGIGRLSLISIARGGEV